MNTFSKQPKIQQKALKKAVASPYIGKHGKRKTTIAKEEALKEIVQRAVDTSSKVLESMLVKAVGSYYVYKRINGHITQLIDPDEIAVALNEYFNNKDIDEDDEDFCYIVNIKDPDTKAGEILLNRAFGKPKEEQSVESHEVVINPETREKMNKALGTYLESCRTCSVCKGKNDK